MLNISEAPRNGTKVIGYDHGFGSYICAYDTDKEAWYSQNPSRTGPTDVVNPTHYMPMPVPGDFDYATIATGLYILLDDISTTGDIVKSDDAAYRRIVERLQEKKSMYAHSSDGHSIEFHVKEEFVNPHTIDSWISAETDKDALESMFGDVTFQDIRLITYGGRSLHFVVGFSPWSGIVEFAQRAGNEYGTRPLLSRDGSKITSRVKLDWFLVRLADQGDVLAVRGGHINATTMLTKYPCLKVKDAIHDNLEKVLTWLDPNLVDSCVLCHNTDDNSIEIKVMYELNTAQEYFGQIEVFKDKYVTYTQDGLSFIDDSCDKHSVDAEGAKAAAMRLNTWWWSLQQ